MQSTVTPSLLGKAALVTGASRGVGAAVAHGLARRGADVALNFRSKAARAEAVAELVRAAGRRPLLAQADITSLEEMSHMMAEVERAFGRLDLLVLNASGGLERGKPPDYPMLLNRDAQLQAVELALPLMPSGGRIVFVTSHLAHFHSDEPVLPEYEPVAASKRAGEVALRQRIQQLEERGVSLVVVSGDLIEGTITPKLLQRARPGLIEERRGQAGELPTVEEFAAAIVDAAGDEGLESGATVYVGSID